MRRVTVCILKGEPKLPKKIKVIAGIAGTWNEHADALGMNLAASFNFLRHQLEKQYGDVHIPLYVIGGGLSAVVTLDTIQKLWMEQRSEVTE